MRQLIPEGFFGFGAREVAAFVTPADDGIHHAPDQLAHRCFALVRVGLAVKIFRSDDVGRRLRPRLGHFDIFLAEDYLAFIIADEGGAAFPFDGVKRSGLAVGKAALEFQADRSSFGFGLHTWNERYLCLSHHLPPRGSRTAERLAGKPREGGCFYFTSNRDPGVAACIERIHA